MPVLPDVYRIAAMSRSIERRRDELSGAVDHIGPRAAWTLSSPGSASDVADDDDVLEPRAVLENRGEQLETF